MMFEGLEQYTVPSSLEAHRGNFNFSLKATKQLTVENLILPGELPFET